jgi:hypothetical protein
MTTKKSGSTKVNAKAAAVIEESWIDVRDAAHMFGMSAPSIKNAILEKRFPVETYKLGKRHVIDRDVLKAFFDRKKASGMRRLEEERPAVKRARRQQRG